MSVRVFWRLSSPLGLLEADCGVAAQAALLLLAWVRRGPSFGSAVGVNLGLRNLDSLAKELAVELGGAALGGVARCLDAYLLVGRQERALGTTIRLQGRHDAGGLEALDQAL